MPFYPVTLRLAGRLCVVVGGGPIAARKAAGLLRCGARLRVVSPEITPELEALAKAGEAEVVRRPFEASDLEGALIAIAATNDAVVNAAAAEAARARDILVNVVDDPEHCDFYAPAVCARGDLQLAVSTSGAFPALAKKLRIELEGQFGAEYAEYVALLAEFRQKLRGNVADAKRRKAIEEAFLASPALDLLRQGRPAEARAALEACLEEQAGQF